MKGVKGLRVVQVVQVVQCAMCKWCNGNSYKETNDVCEGKGESLSM